jgi:hypothetical protein
MKFAEAESNNHDTMSVSSADQRLSIAQRARLDADERSTPVPVWIDEAADASLNDKKKMFGFIGAKKSNDEGSQASGLWRHVEHAILGPRPEDMLTDEGSSSDETDESGLSTPDVERINKNRKAVPDKRRESSGSQSSTVSKETACLRTLAVLPH